MGRICNKKDPIIKLVRETFGANPLNIPETRVQPLSVLTTKEKKIAFRGDIKNLLDDQASLDVILQKSKVADVGYKESAKINRKLGLGIVSGFLKGFGLPTLNISSQFDKVKNISLSFNNIERVYFDEIALGTDMRGKKIWMEHPVMRDIARNELRFLVISEILTSNNFTISAYDKKDRVVALDVSNIKDIVGQLDTKVAVTSETEHQISFNGEERLTFAFGCIEAFWTSAGTIDYTSKADNEFETFPSEDAGEPQATKVLLTPEPELLEIE